MGKSNNEEYRAVTALPHRVREGKLVVLTTGSVAYQLIDDIYEGMLIPEGSTVFIPTWALHHSEHIYDDPDTFNPDRYLKHDKLANDYAGSPDWANRDKLNSPLPTSMTNV
jgi:hypothetical protein